MAAAAAPVDRGEAAFSANAGRTLPDGRHNINPFSRAKAHDIDSERPLTGKRPVWRGASLIAGAPARVDDDAACFAREQARARLQIIDRVRLEGRPAPTSRVGFPLTIHRRRR